ncbi:MAG: AraC family transcriptional regulator [Lachnospiraceae bacterium]|nr:AraC family transcriptional regulator [Lachnospiraceae bacterium]MDD6428396.1 AraC family transcriptional regulator [Lachnospiraceae bacterium]
MNEYLDKTRYTKSQSFSCLENLPEMPMDISLIHYGIEQCKPLHVFRGVRSEYIIHFVMSGHGMYFLDSRCYNIHEGEAFLIEPGASITYMADEADPWVYCWIGFRGQYMDRLLSEIGFGPGTLILDMGSCERISALIRDMLSRHEPDFTDTLFRLSRVYEIFSILSEIHHSRMPAKSDDFIRKTKTYVSNAISYIRQHYADSITVEEIADTVGVSRAYLNKAFRSELNLSVQRFLIDYRMHQAASLLLNTDLPVYQVSSYVGYSDQFTFSKTFKKKFKISPTDYRIQKLPVINSDTKL